MRVYDSNMYSNKTPSIDINLNNLNFAFGLEDRISSNRFVDPSIYYPEILFLDRIKNEEGEFQTVVRKELKYGICKNNSFGDNYNQYFGNIEINNSYCLENFNLTLAGGYKYDRMSYIRIKIIPCVNKSTNENICKPQEVIENFLTGTYLSVLLKDVGLNPSNYSVPTLPTLQNIYTTIDKRFFRDFILNFGITEIQTDTGIFYESFQTEKYLKYIGDEQSFYFRTEEEFKQGKQLCVIQIRLADNIHIQTRTYKKMQEVFSLIGGYMQLLSTAFSLISILTNLDLEVKILNKLFNFNLERNKLSIKIKNIKELNYYKHNNYMNSHYTTKKTFIIKKIKNQYNKDKNNIKHNNGSNNITNKNLIGIDNNNTRNILPIINIVNYNKINDTFDNSQKIINNNISVNNRRSLFQKQYKREIVNDSLHRIKSKSLRGDERVYYRPMRMFTKSFINKNNNDNDNKNNENNINLNLFNYYCYGGMKKHIELFDLGVSLYRRRMDIINAFTILFFSEKLLVKMENQNNFLKKENEVNQIISNNNNNN